MTYMRFCFNAFCVTCLKQSSQQQPSFLCTLFLWQKNFSNSSIPEQFKWINWVTASVKQTSVQTVKLLFDVHFNMQKCFQDPNSLRGAAQPVVSSSMRSSQPAHAVLPTVSPPGNMLGRLCWKRRNFTLLWASSTRAVSRRLLSGTDVGTDKL